MNKTSKKSISLLDLGRSLKTAREKRQQTQRELAAKSAFQQAQVARAEGGADVRVSTLIELSRALGLELKLVPKELVPAVDALIGHDMSVEEKPLYGHEEA